MTALRPPESRPLMREIFDALAAHPEADGIRISITPAPRPLKQQDGGTVQVKWLCWNLTRGEEDLGGKPKLAWVHAGLEEATIRTDLAIYFEGYRCVVDNEIYLGD